MDFLSLVNKRQSERGYMPVPVEKEKIKKCLEAARLAPSACNSQPWKFIVVDDVDLKNAIAANTSNKLLGINHFTLQAPVHVVVVQENQNFSAKFGSFVKQKQFSLIDMGIAVEHFCLQAVEVGLGTCIVGWFDEKAIKKLLHIPALKRVMLIITLGYPSTELREKKRKTLEQVSSFNKY